MCGAARRSSPEDEARCIWTKDSRRIEVQAKVTYLSTTTHPSLTKYGTDCQQMGCGSVVDSSLMKVLLCVHVSWTP